MRANLQIEDNVKTTSLFYLTRVSGSKERPTGPDEKSGQ